MLFFVQLPGQNSFVEGEILSKNHVHSLLSNESTAKLFLHQDCNSSFPWNFGRKISLLKKIQAWKCH